MGIFLFYISYVSVGGRDMQTLKKSINKLDEVKKGGLILLLGLIVGFLFARIFKNLYWDQLDLLDTTYFDKIRTVKMDYSVLLKYVFWKNYKTYILFWILCSTALGIPYITLSILYCGFQSSFFITVILMKYGFKGILLVFGYTFPHYLIYIPLAFLCLRSGYWLCSSMYHDSKLSRKGKIERVARHLVIIIILGGILMIGGLIETYIGSFILKKILVLF